MPLQCRTGKSYICNVLGNHACDELKSVLYCRSFELIDEFNYNMDNMDRVLKKYIKPDFLVLDDFLISEVNKKVAANLFKVLKYGNNMRTTIICSQLDPKEWHKNLGGNILENSIVDRILPKSQPLILSGDSIRKARQQCLMPPLICGIVYRRLAHSKRFMWHQPSVLRGINKCDLDGTNRPTYSLAVWKANKNKKLLIIKGAYALKFRMNNINTQDDNIKCYPFYMMMFL